VEESSHQGLGVEAPASQTTERTFSMNMKFYSALLAFGLATSGLAKAGTSGDPTPTNIELVMNAGFTDTDLHFSMLSHRDYEWHQFSGSALSAERAAIDLAMTTPGLFLDQPVGPAPFFL
jgi:hypothetical protein